MEPEGGAGGWSQRVEPEGGEEWRRRRVEPEKTAAGRAWAPMKIHLEASRLRESCINL